MIQNIGGFQRVCATCEFWSGMRNPDFMQMNVVVDVLNSAGVCMRNGCPFFRSRTQPFNSCNYWEKWGVLR